MANRVEIEVDAKTERAKRGLKGLGSSMKDLGGRVRGAGIAMSGFTALVGVGLKSVLDEKAGIEVLRQSLQNIGRDYEDVGRAIEDQIAKNQALTNFGDEEQRAVLSMLIGMFGDEKKALEALGLSMDLATVKQSDLKSAAQQLGPVLLGQTHNLRGTGLEFDKAASSEERFSAATDELAGKAQAAANPLIQLQNSLGDLLQSVIRPLVGDDGKGPLSLLVTVMRQVVAVFDKLPKPVREFIGIAMLLAAALGPILLLFGGMVALIGGPVILAVGAAVAAVAGLIVVFKHLWDTGKLASAWATVFEFVKKHVLDAKADFQALWAIVSGGAEIAFNIVKTYIRLLKAVFTLDITAIKNIFGDLWQSIKNTDAFTFLVDMFQNIHNSIVGILNKIINAWNALEFTIPGFGGIKIGKHTIGAFEGFSIGTPNIPNISTMGGRNTLEVNVNGGMFLTDENTRKQFAEVMADKFKDMQNRGAMTGRSGLHATG